MPEMWQNDNDVINIWKYHKISYNIVKCKVLKCIVRLCMEHMGPLFVVDIGLNNISFRTWLITMRARFVGPTWGPSGTDRTRVGPMLAPGNLLSGYRYMYIRIQLRNTITPPTREVHHMGKYHRKHLFTLYCIFYNQLHYLINDTLTVNVTVSVLFCAWLDSP